MEAETPLIEHMSTPFVFDHKQRIPFERAPLLKEKAHFPEATWTRAKKLKDGRQFPQTIAHRGFKAKHPENTMGAFEGAVCAGADAIETDIHLTKDGVVVLSHDATLKRCFGVDKKIIDCDWKEISDLPTLKEPYERMPRLQELLEYLARPGLEHLWVLLDIKLDNNSDDVMRLIASTIKSVSPGRRAWIDRVVLGCWAAKFLPLCEEYLPNFPITHIGFSTCYARRFLKVPNVSFNMLQKIMMGPFGAKFLADVKAADRQIFLWTVNEKNMMGWSIRREVDGVITDDPETFKDICDNWDDSVPEEAITWRQYLFILWIYVLVLVFGTLFRVKYREGVGRYSRRQ